MNSPKANDFTRKCGIESLIILCILSLLPCILSKIPPFVLNELKESKIIPDLVEEPPSFGCQVEYLNNTVDFGNTVKSYQACESPIETYWPTDKGKLYTILMIDMDAPNPKSPTLREYLYWLVINVPEDKSEHGQIIAPYVEIFPPTHEGRHRFVFLVFQQPKSEEMKCKIKTLRPIPYDKERGNFSWKNFAKEHDLGHPHGINFFYGERGHPMEPTESNAWNINW